MYRVEHAVEVTLEVGVEGLQSLLVVVDYHHFKRPLLLRPAFGVKHLADALYLTQFQIVHLCLVDNMYVAGIGSDYLVFVVVCE